MGLVRALLYVESHAVSGSGGPRETRVVSYRCANGATFARKTLDFGVTRLAPEFALDDALGGVSEGLERGDDRRPGGQRVPAVGGRPAGLAAAGHRREISRNDRRLLRHRGITNLRDGAGALISAQIDFSDADRTDTAVDLAALRAQPLTSSCGS